MKYFLKRDNQIREGKRKVYMSVYEKERGIRRTIKSLGVLGKDINKTEAKRVLSDYEASKVPIGDLTFLELSEKFISAYSREWSGSKKKSYVCTLKRMTPYIGRIYAKDLGLDDFIKLEFDMSKSGLAMSTISMDFVRLKSILNYGLQSGAVKNVRYFYKRIRVLKKHPFSLNREQLGLLRSNSNKDQLFATDLLVSTGLRPMEFDKLLLGDIDFRGNMICVKSEIKNKSMGERKVFMDGYLKKAIMARFKGLLGQKNLRVSPYSSVDSLRDTFSRLSRKAGIPITPRIFRKTYSTFMHNSGIDSLKVAKMMGHKNLGTQFYYLADISDLDQTKLSKVNFFGGKDETNG